MKALAMVHDVDPKTAIMEAVGPLLEGAEPMGARVLVAIYIRPNKTRSGLYLSDRSVEEDRHQSKVGLVLKLGPLAFVEDETHKFGGRVPQVGDWVIYRIGDTFPAILGETDIRFVEDVSIVGIIDRPDVVM